MLDFLKKDVVKSIGYKSTSKAFIPEYKEAFNDSKNIYALYHGKNIMCNNLSSVVCIGGKGIEASYMILSSIVGVFSIFMFLIVFDLITETYIHGFDFISQCFSISVLFIGLGMTMKYIYKLLCIKENAVIQPSKLLFYVLKHVSIFLESPVNLCIFMYESAYNKIKS